MDLAIVHYHLQTGGVTRVIAHACAALAARGHRLLVLTGEPPQHAVTAHAGPAVADAVAVAVIPGLGYEERRPALSPDALAAALLDAARHHFGQPPDLWHIHNHCLGKNLALPAALIRLLRHGQRLLLQPHDFAEDGRPALYRRLRDRLADGDAERLAALLYPLAPQVHYAALNARDRHFLAETGVPAECLHLLPNAVTPPPAGSDEKAGSVDGAPPWCAPGQRLWLYPTRAIRRKNLGELLLWATVAGEADRFATTQAPQNPQEQMRYRAWVKLAGELSLPVELELGQRADFAALVRASHALVTTSIAEGFGLAFLEPWLSGKPLAGRDLPEITADFRGSGVDLGGLYQALRVPLEWLDTRRLRQAYADALSANAAAYGRAVPPDALERAWEAAIDDGGIDFARLDEQAQAQIIRRLHADADARGALTPARLMLNTDGDTVAANAQAIQAHYGLAGYGERLERIYGAVVDSTPTARLRAGSSERLLAAFQDPRRLLLLRT